MSREEKRTAKAEQSRGSSRDSLDPLLYPILLMHHYQWRLTRLLALARNKEYGKILQERFCFPEEGKGGLFIPSLSLSIVCSSLFFSMYIH